MAGLLIMFNSCSDGGYNVQSESSIPVRVQTLALKPMKEYVSATGTVYSVKEAQLKVEQAGEYHLMTNPRTGLPFAMGDEVLANELVVTIHNPEYVNQVAIDSKKLNYEISQREFEKQQRIHKKGGITLRELSDAERTFIDAGYAYENAKLGLEKLKITVPFKGIIVDLPYFSPNLPVDVNTAVMQVMDYSKLNVDVTLPGKEMGRVLRGQRVEIRNYNSSEIIKGLVTQVSPSIDPTSRMFKLRVTIDNKDLKLKPGMFTQVDIVVNEKESTLVIPREIVLDRRGAKTVFVVERGIALERKLEIGMMNNDSVEVLKGLSKENRLVVEGYETLRHRSRVKVIK
jgi:membrane fusion protein, multidrug efflux system